MGDGPDWRQVDRARVLAAFEDGKKAGMKAAAEEWIAWCREQAALARISVFEDEARWVFEDETLREALAFWLDEKATELCARLAPQPIPLPPPQSTTEKEDLPTPLATGHKEVYPTRD